MISPEFQLLEAFRRNVAQRLPEFSGRVVLGRRAATKKAECPRVCFEYLTDVTMPFSASRGRRVETTAHVQIAIYDWFEESEAIEELLLNKYALVKTSIGDIMREMSLGRNCPDGFNLLNVGEMRGATAATPVNSTSRISLYGYDFPSLTFEALIGED